MAKVQHEARNQIPITHRRGHWGFPEPCRLRGGKKWQLSCPGQPWARSQRKAAGLSGCSPLQERNVMLNCSLLA